MNKTDGRGRAPESSLRAALEMLPDVRRGQGKVHPLDGMLALAVCALLCGCRSLYAISQWGRECTPEIRVALGLRAERGPSIATLHRAFRRLDHAAFERVLGQWFAAQGSAPEEALAIDGKTLRGIHGEEIPGVHLVAAYAHQTRVVLAQAERLDPEEGEADTIAGWAGLAQVCRIHREVEYVSGTHIGTAREDWVYAMTSLTPDQADAARLELLWRGH